MKFDWNDISIVPETLSTISSRSEINVIKDGKLPLFTAPMDTVIDNTNYTVFENEYINICLPRHIKYDDLKNDTYFYSYGLDEIISIVENKEFLPKKIHIDIANGHMIKLYDISKRIKEEYDIELMIGNIANPKTYGKFCEIGVDYVKCGIGGGSACFVSDTKIITSEGVKNIEDIKIDDMVLTHDNTYQKVLMKHILSTNDDLININDTISTKEHKYYVLDKKYVDIVNDDNIDKYAVFISAEHLTDKYLLIEIGD